MMDTQQLDEISRQIQLSLRENRLRDAESLLTRYCHLHDSSAGAWGTLAAIHKRFNELGRAKECLEHAVRLDSGNQTLLLELADICMRQSGFAEALSSCRRVLEGGSESVAACVIGGQACMRMGDLEQAATMFRRGIAGDQKVFAAHTGLAACLQHSGDIRGAAMHYRQATAIDPGPVEPWWELGNLSAQLEDFPTVERCCREVILRNPSAAPAYLYLGIALQRQGKYAEAEQSLHEALLRVPDSAEACFNLGLVQDSQGKADAAMQSFRRALDSGMEPGRTYHNMSMLHSREGRWNEALECGFKALRHAPNSLKYRQNFVHSLRAALPSGVDGDMMSEILRSFETTGIDSKYLMKPCMMLMLQNGQLQELANLAAAGERERIGTLVRDGHFADLFSIRLLKALLQHTVVASVTFEQVLRVLRSVALELISTAPPGRTVRLFDADDSFAVALACQFFNREYAVAGHADEELRVNALAESSGAALQNGMIDDSFRQRLIVLCMYHPLHEQEWVHRMQAVYAPGANDLIDRLVKLQWLDFREESEYLQQTEQLTPVMDTVSLAVREQYEESPYPRWNSVEIRQPLSRQSLFRTLFPAFEPPVTTAEKLDVLIAGCGTGRHAIMAASHYGGAEVLALDLSARSLAFARRKAAELAITNIRFAQADILELAQLDRKFQIIESVGVLHHMQDPEAGLHVLVDLLPENGFIRLGLYSEAGRRDVLAAREYIAKRNIGTTPDGIRLARSEIMLLPDGRPEKRVTRFRDFYSMSECRDLLFHVQELRFDLGKVCDLLATAGLRFAGFEFNDSRTERLYAERFPGDPAMLDLDNWRIFEAGNPDTFSEMYKFWCQKIPYGK